MPHYDVRSYPMKVLVTTPYERNSLQGNNVTAMRLVSILSESGMDVGMICKDEQVSGADVLIALHARKSAHFIDDFLKMNPVGKVIVYLTGTDLYRDIPNGCKICENSMNLADALVVSNDASLASIPQKFRLKSTVVQKSIYLPDLEANVVTQTNLFTVVGHLREVKQPFMAVESMQLLDGSVRLVLLGDAVALNYDSVAMGWQARDPRFEWLGRREYREALKWMQRSVATINTSLVEGGANSVGESIVLGVPVLASRIEGNVGMLGEDYDGYFSPDDKQELANLMSRVISGGKFLERLRDQVRARAKIFLRENEKRGWMKLIQKVF